MAELMMAMAGALLGLGGAGCWAELWETGSSSRASLPKGR
jgi:hypothetical protein